MSNYVVTTDFAAKDALPSGNPAKVAKGADVALELNNIATMSATKQDTTSKGIANGYAGLDASAFVPRANLPSAVDYLDTIQTFTVSKTFTPTAGVGITVNAIANSYGQVINGSSTTGQSYGLKVQAGTNGSDLALAVLNQAATQTFLSITGSGNVSIGISGGSNNAVGSTWAFNGGNITGVTNLTASGTITGNLFSGSGASLTSLVASNLASGTVPTARLGVNTASSANFLRGDSAWVAVDFSNLTGSIANGQVPSGAVTQYNSSITGRNISVKTGISKTLQNGGTASGGADGDIIYIY